MTESYKLKSKIATAIGGICTIITTLGIPQLTQIFPGYGQYIPAIVAAATWYLSQTTENTRVDRAEKIIEEKYQKQQTYNEYDDILTENTPATEENVAGDTDDI